MEKNDVVTISQTILGYLNTVKEKIPLDFEQDDMRKYAGAAGNVFEIEDDAITVLFDTNNGKEIVMFPKEYVLKESSMEK